MRVSKPFSSANVVEAAADRVMQLRDTVMEELSKQHHLGERDLVIAGLKYLHQRVGLKK